MKPCQSVFPVIGRSDVEAFKGRDDVLEVLIWTVYLGGGERLVFANVEFTMSVMDIVFIYAYLPHLFVLDVLALS